jgi:hypothetical protein
MDQPEDSPHSKKSGVVILSADIRRSSFKASWEAADVKERRMRSFYPDNATSPVAEATALSLKGEGSIRLLGPLWGF